MKEFNFNTEKEVGIFIEMCTRVCGVKRLKVEPLISGVIKVVVHDPLSRNTLDHLEFERASIITTGKLSKSYK